MKWTLEEKALTGGLGVILLLAGLVSFVSYKNTIDIVESANQAQHTYEVLNSLTDFYAVMTVAESGRRGYIFSGMTYELRRHQKAIQDMEFELKDLHRLLNKNSIHQQRLNSLDNLVQRRLALFKESIDLYQQDPTAVETQGIITDQSIEIREKIQVTLTEIKNQEKQKLNLFLEQSHLIINSRIVIEQLGMFLSFIVICFVFFFLYKSRIRHQKLQTLEQTLRHEKELSELKLRLFSMISHEFRTPLSVILASSQLLREILETQIAPQELKNLSRIQTSAQLMNQLLTDILTLTRAETGKLECKPEWLDVESFCLNLLEDIQSFNLIKHTLKFSIKGKGKRIFLDEKMLYSILSNLLLNAIKYSPEDSQIELMLQYQSEATIFQVKDQGMGIPPEDQEKIFDPFYRAKNVESIGGTGLGLAVVKTCVELHQGRIYLESKIRQGTTFVVEIPPCYPDD